MNLPLPHLLFQITLLLYALWMLAKVPSYWRGSFPPRVANVIGSDSVEGAKMRAGVRLTPSGSVFLIVFSVSFLVFGSVEPKSTMAYASLGR